MIPITRKELYLNKIVGNNDYETPEKPITIEEFFFAEILGEAVQAPEPLTRYQIYLAKIAGRNIETPYPETRLEYFLARAAGMDVETPAPITKEEIYWSNYTAIVEFEVEGVPPLTYKAIEGTLENYRIYGNTVGGESVGDRTGNLFDGIYPNIKGPVTYRAIYVGTGIFTLSGDIPIFFDTANLFLLTGNVSDGASSPVNGVGYGVPRSAESIDGYITIGYRNYYDVDPRDYNIMLNVGSTPLPYEPYGYKVPIAVTNSGTTSNETIYLPEQIRKVGDVAEYVDYKKQKQYFADGTSVDVTLPALPILSGTNTLSVETEVQPSKVYIKSKFKRITTTYVQSIEPDNTNNKIKFVVRAYRSKNDRIVRAGLVATNDPAIGVNINVNSTVITSGCEVFVKKGTSVTPTTDNIKYTWTKTKVTDGEIWYVRSYVEYINSDNEQLIIYSDAAKASLDGII